MLQELEFASHTPQSSGLNFLNIGSGTGYLNCIVHFVQQQLDPQLRGCNHGIDIWNSTLNYSDIRLQTL